MTKKNATPKYYHVKVNAELTDLPEFLQKKIEKMLVNKMQDSYQQGKQDGLNEAARAADLKAKQFRENASVNTCSQPVADPLQAASQILRSIMPYSGKDQNQILNAVLYRLRQGREVDAQYALVVQQRDTDQMKAHHADAVLSLNSLKDLLA